MNQSDFSKLHDVSRKTVTGLKAPSWLVFVGEEIDVKASNKLIERHRKVVTRTEKKPQVTRKVTNRQGNRVGNKFAKGSADPLDFSGWQGVTSEAHRP